MSEAPLHDALVRARPAADGALVVELAGDWRARPGLPGIAPLSEALAAHPGTRALAFDTAGLGRWNSGLLVWLVKCAAACRARGVEMRVESLPEGLRKLLHLSESAPEKTDARHLEPSRSPLHALGAATLRGAADARAMLAFLGDGVLALGRLARGQAQFPRADLLLVMQQCGPRALGIVALINFLVGMILAFVGSVQLEQFGAANYVADLVAVATVREMGCLMTGIIVCGRTGAAFAAQLGTMTVNEEIDALRTFGIAPMDFLVLPRVLALLAMMPFLVVFADLIALAGGFLVSGAILDVTSTEYLRRTFEAITLPGFLLGVFKGACFGVIVALTGCLRGLQSGRTAAAVGEATTSAVVVGITSIVAADGVFAVVTNALRI